MPRLIDADALGKTDRPVGKLMMFGGEYVYTQTEIDRAPTIDAVPVVRCRDCIYYKEGKLLGPTKFCYRLKGHDGSEIGYNFAEDEYCSRGQRREDGDG